MKRMSNMKKILVFCLVITLAFSVVGCGKKASTDNNTATAPTSTATVTPAVTEVPIVTGTHAVEVAEKDKVPQPPIVIKDTSDQNKKLSAKEKAKMKKVVAFTQNLANDRQIILSNVTSQGNMMVGTFEVKPEFKAADAKTLAEKYAKDMKAAYGQSVKVIINQNGKMIAEASL